MKFLTVVTILMAWAAVMIGNVLNIIHCSYPFFQFMSVFAITVDTMITGALIPVIACSKNL